MSERTTIIPALRYRDARAAIEWLQRAFGFEEHLVVPGDGGIVEHAQLTLGTGMIMLGSVRDSPEWPASTAAELGGVTGGIYVVVSDPRAHFERAREAGAEIVKELEDQEYGGSDYTVRDLEGNLWSFGSYDPWA